MDFDLSDALDDQNDGQGGGMPNVHPGGRGTSKNLFLFSLAGPLLLSLPFVLPEEGLSPEIV